MLLKELQLNYRELDSNEFSKIKKFEEPSQSESIYPYAYGYHKYLDYANTDLIDINYAKGACWIGDTEVNALYGELCTNNRDAYKYFMTTCEKKSKMGVEEFTEL